MADGAGCSTRVGMYGEIGRQVPYLPYLCTLGCMFIYFPKHSGNMKVQMTRLFRTVD